MNEDKRTIQLLVIRAQDKTMSFLIRVPVRYQSTRAEAEARNTKDPGMVPGTGYRQGVGVGYRLPLPFTRYQYQVPYHGTWNMDHRPQTCTCSAIYSLHTGMTRTKCRFELILALGLGSGSGKACCLLSFDAREYITQENNREHTKHNTQRRFAFLFDIR